MYTESARLMADGLTKAFQGSRFQEFLRQLGMQDISAQLCDRTLPELSEEEVQS